MNSTELQERVNTYNSRKIELKSKPWFRALIVVYYLFAALSVGFVLLLATALSDQWLTVLFWGAVIVFGLFKLIGKVAYYIILGNVHTIKTDPTQELIIKK